MDQGQGRPITDCAMGSHFIVFDPPFFDLSARVVQIEEPVLAEALHAHGRVEAFCVSIVGRLARAAEIQGDSVRVRPEIEFLRGELASLVNADRHRVARVRGVGTKIATGVIAAVGDGREFKNARHMAAWLGLMARQHSSGNRRILTGISKRGDQHLRTLLVHRARAVERRCGPKPRLTIGHQLPKHRKSPISGTTVMD